MVSNALKCGKAEGRGEKRVSEEAAKKLKIEAQQAIKDRDKAMYLSREAVVRLKNVLGHMLY